MDHHRALGGPGLLSPHPAVNFLRGEHPAQVAHEQVHNARFDVGQLHRFAVGGEHTGGRIVGQPPAGDGPVRGGVHVPQAGVPAKLAAYTGRQLLHAEGLGDVVVRPHAQAQHLVALLALGGQHDHRQVAPLPDAQHGGQPVQPGHHHVHEDQPQVGVQRLVQRLHAVVGPKDPPALLLQGGGDGPYDLTVVVHYQYGLLAHWVCSFLVRCGQNSRNFLQNKRDISYGFLTFYASRAGSARGPGERARQGAFLQAGAENYAERQNQALIFVE